MQITGMMVYYSQVCHRKLWYFSHEIRMEQQSDLVTIGKLIDEGTYTRDEKHIQIDNVMNIDFIRSRKILHEVKKSRKIESASILQVKYYLYYLRQRGASGFTGQIDYPLLKKNITVELTSEDESMLESLLAQIQEIIARRVPPERVKKGICKSCAYFDLCFI
ncbi:MAG: CRISPR-associated protein Cas4 [Planctomycetia bacterium]|nr:CRISPR-associated protein Cas4 [Planctomycetia bacterium]